MRDPFIVIIGRASSGTTMLLEGIQETIGYVMNEPYGGIGHYGDSLEEPIIHPRLIENGKLISHDIQFHPGWPAPPETAALFTSFFGNYLRYRRNSSGMKELCNIPDAIPVIKRFCAGYTVKIIRISRNLVSAATSATMRWPGMWRGPHVQGARARYGAQKWDAILHGLHRDHRAFAEVMLAMDFIQRQETEWLREYWPQEHLAEVTYEGIMCGLPYWVSTVADMCEVNRERMWEAFLETINPGRRAYHQLVEPAVMRDRVAIARDLGVRIEAVP